MCNTIAVSENIYTPYTNKNLETSNYLSYVKLLWYICTIKCSDIKQPCLPRMSNDMEKEIQ